MSDIKEPNKNEYTDAKILKTCNLSIASMVCFLLGIVSLIRCMAPFENEYVNKTSLYLPWALTYIFCLLAIILGILAIIKIKKHQGILGGKRLAYFGLFLGILLFVYSLFINVGFWLDETSSELQLIKHGRDKISMLGQMLIHYANDNNGILPNANNWCDALSNYHKGIKREDFQHPDTDGFECDYAFNKNVSEKKLSELPENTIILFESSGKWNLNGDYKLLENSTKRIYFINVILADGTMQVYSLKSKILMRETEEIPLWRP